MFFEITSPSNSKVKEAAKLRDAKHRRKLRRFLIDGLREIDRAVRSGIKILEVFGNKETIDRFSRNGYEKAAFYCVSDTVLEKIAFGNRNEGIVVVAEVQDQTVETFETAIQSVETPLFSVLESIEKPGNIGAMFRSADGAGLDGIVMTGRMAGGHLTDLYNPNTIRASLGTVFRLPSVEMISASVIDWLRQRNITIAVARCDGAIPYTDYDFRRPTAIVLGSEAEGLSDIWHGSEMTAISLPMLGIADSLNVSNAAAILFYEARRQRIGHCELRKIL